MSTTVYDDLLNRVQSLPAAEQLRLLEDLAALVRQRLDDSARRSILELQGLGKEVWGVLDAQEYVDRERREQFPTLGETRPRLRPSGADSGRSTPQRGQQHPLGRVQVVMQDCAILADGPGFVQRERRDRAQVIRRQGQLD
jgi:hypothetical protein